MKKIAKIICLVLLAVFVLPVLVACGDVVEDDKGSVTLSIAVVSTKTEVNIVEKLIEGFTAKAENKGIKFRIIKMANFDSYVVKNFGKSTMADMISVYDYNAEYWTYMKLLRSVTEYMQRDGINENDYVPIAMNLGKSGAEGDNNYYWLPRDYNKVVMCYNTEMFEIAGIDKPSDDWTMDDFNEVCRRLNEKAADIKSKFGKYEFYPVEMNIKWTAVYYPFIKSYGGDFLADGGTLFKNTDAVKTAVNKLLAYADKKGGDNPEALEYTNPVGESGDSSAFINKQAAMTFTVRPNVQSYADKLNNNIDFVSMPRITDNDGNTSYIGTGCSGYGITSDCPDDKAELCWKFLKYIVSEEGQNIMGKSGSGVPILKSLLDNDNAEWKNFISADLNHEAFVKYPERDLAMNYVHGFKVEKQLSVYKELKDNFIYKMYNSEDRNDAFNRFKKQVDDLLRVN